VKSCHLLHGKEIHFSQTDDGLIVHLGELDKKVVDNIIVLELER